MIDEIMNVSIDDRMNALHKNDHYFGHHGTLFVDKNRSGYVVLKDGTEVFQGDSVGKLELVRNIPESTNPFEVATLIRNNMFSKVAMLELKEILESDSFENVKVLTGISHFAGTRLFEKLGFTVTKLDVLSRCIYTLVTMWMIHDRKAFKKKFTKVGRVWIGKDKMIGICNQVINQSDMLE